MTALIESVDGRSADNLDHSRELDVHRWSDFPEADTFVDDVYRRCQQGKRTSIERKHFKVVLLDLYLAWLIDPRLKLSVPMYPAAYKAKSRYNALHISKKTIEVVRLLKGAGLIDMKLGFHDRREGGRSRLTRVWPSSRLIALFRDSQLDPSRIGRADEEVIILKDEQGKKIEYEDTAETYDMRNVVREYNDLLSHHLIDIRRLNEPWIVLTNGSLLMIGRERQRVHRVFNRSSFDYGGRFVGPWWQQCPKDWRREIFINDAPTIEQDYSSLHIALMYARKGANFYQDYPEDAYQLPTPDFIPTPELTRHYAKRLFLIAVNATNDKSAFAAFRSGRRSKGDAKGSSLTDKQLAVLLNGLRKRHPLIAGDLGSDAGITLMRDDSRITEHVIKRFTERGLAVLTVHDSYIVHFGYHDLLQQVLEEAFMMVTGMSEIRSERTGVAWTDESSWESQRLRPEALVRSEGYAMRMIDWLLNSKESERVVGRDVHLVG